MVLKRYGWQIAGVFSLIIAIILTVLVARDGILPMDTAGYDWIADHIIHRWLTPIVLVITRLASAAVLITLTVLILIFVKNRKIGIAVAATLIGEAIINIIIKSLMRRDRPNVTRLAIEHGYSFPSGHAMASTAVYGLCIYLIYRYMKQSTGKVMLMIALAVLVPVIMFTRVYLGVHYVSDVLAGFFYSFAYLTLIAIPLIRTYLLPTKSTN